MNTNYGQVAVGPLRSKSGQIGLTSGEKMGLFRFGFVGFIGYLPKYNCKKYYLVLTWFHHVVWCFWLVMLGEEKGSFKSGPKYSK